MLILLLFIPFLAHCSPSVLDLLSSGRVDEALAVAKHARRTLALNGQKVGDTAWRWVHDDVVLQRYIATPLNRTVSSKSEVRVTATFSDGSTASVHPSSAFLPTGAGVPVQGILHQGKLYVDRDAHECHVANVGISCTIGGSSSLKFRSEESAAAAASARRDAASMSFIKSLGLSPGLESTPGDSRIHRALQMGALNQDSLQKTNLSLTGGRRKILAFRASLTGLVDYPANVIANQMADFKFVYESRSFGSLILDITVPSDSCTYDFRSPTWPFPEGEFRVVTNLYFSLSEHPDAACRFTVAQLDAFHHLLVLLPEALPGVYFGGLGQFPGRWTWISSTKASDKGDAVIAHELAHNFGLPHASTYFAETCPDRPIYPYQDYNEYGDVLDVMGSGEGMLRTDLSAAAKHFSGWIPDSAVVNIDGRWGTGTLQGTPSSGEFLLAPFDRDNTPGDRKGVLASIPAGVAFTARATVPYTAWPYGRPGFPADFDYPSSRYPRTYLYFGFRSRLSRMLKSPAWNTLGVYFSAGLWFGWARNWKTFMAGCYRDPSCNFRYPVAPYDGTVLFDSAGGSRYLLEVGPPTQVFTQPPPPLPPPAVWCLLPTASTILTTISIMHQLFSHAFSH